MRNYRELIDLTSDTLTARTQQYRRLVISFGTIGLITLCTIVITMSPRPAIGLLFLLPAYGLFLLFDNRSLNVWRASILDAWRAKDVDLFALREALTTNKALPPQTLKGMLDTLPELGDFVTEHSVSSSTRKALAVFVTARDDDLNNKLLCQAASHTVIAIIVISAVALQLLLLLFVIVLIPVIRILCKWYQNRSVSNAGKMVMRYAERSDFDPDTYKRIATSLAFHSSAGGLKKRFADFVGSA